jgi:hypothetical protein
LRTAFIAGGLNEPLQVVRKAVELTWIHQDWRHLSTVEQEEQLNGFLEADRRTGFELARTPLLRLALIQIAESTCHFVLSHHHILLDGWSVALVLKDVLSFYESFSQGTPIGLTPARPYRDYIACLNSNPWMRQRHSGENSSKALAHRPR